METFSHSFLWGHFHLWLCSCSTMCAAILSSFCLQFSTFSAFFHLFELFLPSYSTPFWPFFTFLSYFNPLTPQPFSLYRYSSVCLFNCFHLTSCSAIKIFNFFNSFSPCQLFCLFIFLKYSSFCLFRSFIHSASCSAFFSPF